MVELVLIRGFCFVSESGLSLCRSGWPRTCSVAQIGPKLTEIHLVLCHSPKCLRQRRMPSCLTHGAGIFVKGGRTIPLDPSVCSGSFPVSSPRVTAQGLPRMQVPSPLGFPPFGIVNNISLYFYPLPSSMGFVLATQTANDS